MKKYSINVEHAEIVSVEVDGVLYRRSGEVPDPEDRAWMELLASTSPFMEAETADAGPFALPRIITPLFLAVAILMLTIATITGVRTFRSVSKETSAPGQVLELVVRRDDTGKEFYYPLVEYYLPGNMRQTVQVLEGSWPPAYEAGQEVTIRYDPSRPGEARIASTGGTIGRFTVSIITGILGVAFSLATVFAYWVLKSNPTEPS